MNFHRIVLMLVLTLTAVAVTAQSDSNEELSTHASWKTRLMRGVLPAKTMLKEMKKLWPMRREPSPTITAYQDLNEDMRKKILQFMPTEVLENVARVNVESHQLVRDIHETWSPEIVHDLDKYCGKVNRKKVLWHFRGDKFEDGIVDLSGIHFEIFSCLGVIDRVREGMRQKPATKIPVKLDGTCDGAMLAEWIVGRRQVENFEATTVTEVSFTRNPIVGGYTSEEGDHIVDFVRRNTEITSLSIELMANGNEGVEKLINVLLESDIQLHSLNFVESAIDDVGAEHLANFLSTPQAAQLRVLNLRKNLIGEDGIRLIVENLKKLSHLEELNLEENNLGAGGASVIARALQGNGCNLRTLNIGKNSIQWDGAVAISKALKTNSLLSALHYADNGVQIVDPDLKHQFEESCPEFNQDTIMSYFGGAPIRKHIHFQMSPQQHARNCLLFIDDRLSEVLPYRQSHKIPVGLSTFFRSKEAGLAAMFKVLEMNLLSTSIASLDVYNQKISDKSLNRLISIIRQLRNLSLVNSKIDDKGAIKLARALKMVEGGCLENLDLRNAGIGDTGATALAAVLATSSSLVRVYLNDNRIGDVGASYLAQALRNLPSKSNFQVLLIAGNRISERGIAELEAAAKSRKVSIIKRK